jgi:hypothetical protein
MKHPRLLALFLVALVAVSPLAAAATEVLVPSDVSGPMWWTFDAPTPTVIKLEPNLPSPAVNGSDNLRIGFITQVKEAGGNYEVLTIRFKTNGMLTVGSPRYGVADQEVAQWSNNETVKIVIIDDTIEVYVGSTKVWSYVASEAIPDINYVYADSATYGTPAFQGGGQIRIYVDTTELNSILINYQMKESMNVALQLFTSFMPLILVFAVFGMFMKFFNKILRGIGRAF